MNNKTGYVKTYDYSFFKKKATVTDSISSNNYSSSGNINFNSLLANKGIQKIGEKKAVDNPKTSETKEGGEEAPKKTVSILGMMKARNNTTIGGVKQR